MDDQEGAAARVDALGVERLTDDVVAAWLDHGLDSDGRWTWPDDETRYRLRLPEPGHPAGLDALATVLDETGRTPATVAVHVAAGRRTDPVGPGRTALADLAAIPGITALDTDTAGTAPAGADVFEAVFRRYDEGLLRLAVLDADDEAVVEYLDGTLEFALPAGAVAAVRSALDGDLAARLQQR